MVRVRRLRCGRRDLRPRHRHAPGLVHRDVLRRTRLQVPAGGRRDRLRLRGRRSGAV